MRKFINLNRKLSKKIESIFPEKFRLAGGEDFQKNIIPNYLCKNLIIYEVGGGKRPYLSKNEKEKINAKVIGVDISEQELTLAPNGCYDDIIISPIELVNGSSDGDLVICNAVLEHVHDTDKAIKGIKSILKKDGIALLFVPCKNAAYARINSFLPEELKAKILFKIYPKKVNSAGFPAYYDRCTPKTLLSVIESNGFILVQKKHYFWSSYFSFFAPLYLLWRIYFFSLYALIGNEACEGFTIIIKKT